MGYANYWVRYEDHVQPAQLNEGERLAARRGYSDGLFQATVGIDVALGRRFGFVGELRYFVRCRTILEMAITSSIAESSRWG